MPTLADTVLTEARTIEHSAAHLEEAARSTLADTTAGFLRRTLDAVPNWVLMVLGTMTGFGLCLSLVLFTSGLTGPVRSVLESFAVSIARSSSKFDQAADKLDRMIARLDTMQQRYEDVAATVADQKQRLAAVETKVDAIVAATTAGPPAPFNAPAHSPPPLSLPPKPVAVQKRKPSPGPTAAPSASTAWPIFN